MFLTIVMADSCQKSFFKTSISRNHAYRVLHSRFPPFGFVLKPIWSIHLFFNMIMADSRQKSFCGSIFFPRPQLRTRSLVILRGLGWHWGPGPPRGGGACPPQNASVRGVQARMCDDVIEKQGVCTEGWGGPPSPPLPPSGPPQTPPEYYAYT